jgi:transposase InsO family protein
MRSRAADFLRRLIAAVPYKVDTVRTDNGAHFTTPGDTRSAAPDIKAALEAEEPVWAHAFEDACAQNDIDHRLTKPRHPWTNRQVERMNGAINDATVKRHFYATHDQLRTQLQNFAVERFQVTAKGQTDPVVPTAPDRSEERNRRVEITWR